MTKSDASPTTRRFARLARGIRESIKIILPVVVLAGGAFVAFSLMATSPKALRQPLPKTARLVELEPVRFGSEAVVVDAMGTVQAARTIDLQPRVSGSVNWISEEFVPGGLYKAGEKILTLDPTDFQLAVAQNEASVVSAQSDLDIERGQQAIAQQEFELLGRNDPTMSDEERALILRAPQLAEVTAALQTSQASLRKARLDLQRTTVTVPFDAAVQVRNVDLGSQVTTSTTLATLVGTETYWIEAMVPVDRLQWIDVPKKRDVKGSTVRVYNESAWGQGVFRNGHVIRLENALEEDGRMARLLVEIDDPLSLRPGNAAQPPILIGSYVRVEIEGVRIGPAALVDREWVRDNDTVWLMNADGTLRIQPVEILYRGKERVIVDGGITAGEKIVVTDIAAPVDGMLLRTRDAAGADGRPTVRGNAVGGPQ